MKITSDRSTDKYETHIQSSQPYKAKAYCWPELALGQPRITLRSCRVSALTGIELCN